MDFNIGNLWGFEIGGVEIWITQTILSTWIIMAVLILGAVILRIKLRKMEDVPSSKLQNVVEAVIEAFDNFVKSTAGEKAQFVGSWFFMVFVFVFLSNISGLVGLRPPTADWATTFALALVTFFLIHVVGVYTRGFGYVKSLFKPFFIFGFFLNVIGELSRPISLSFRLFGNILSGLILMTMIYSMAPLVTRFVLPVGLHIYFDVFVGILQTYVFCALSMTFIGTASHAEE